jgi:hypothetical protein
VAELSHAGEYCRREEETVRADTTVVGGLLIFVKILTTVFVRNVVLRRSMKDRGTLVLKSRICGEIILESRIKVGELNDGQGL